MSEKRRDSKGRILRTGESQRKDGRYAYKYTDAYGKPQFVYSWRLVATDKAPAGKRDDLPLREKVKEIQRDLDDGIDTIGKKMTVCQLYAKKNSQRKNVKRNTEKGRQYLMKILENDPLGARSIDTVKLSDGKEWAMRMYENGFSYKTISNYKRSLKASFYMAIEDDCIRKNPFNFKLSDVLEDNSEPKVILTPEQEEKMLAFMEQDKTYSKYYDESFCCQILHEFGLYDDDSHIINGHTPVHAIEGENPVRAKGRLFVIDGGFCRSMNKATGIAGYTLIFNSHGLRLKAHTPFTSVEDALMNNTDIESSSEIIEKDLQRMFVKDTDIGKHLLEEISDLRKLLENYRRL